MENFTLFYFLLNDTRFHLVLDCICILPLILTGAVSQIFDPENLNDDLPMLVGTLGLKKMKLLANLVLQLCLV